MKVKEIMTTAVAVIDSTNSLEQAAQRMKSLNVGVLPVREGTKLIGLITDRDIVVRALAERRDTLTTQVKDIVSSQLVWCAEEDRIEDAVKLMEEKQVRRLLVCDQDRTPTGILSLGDIAAKTRQEELVGAALESISEPASPAKQP
jgi:CBS domain-containing protein